MDEVKTTLQVLTYVVGLAVFVELIRRFGFPGSDKNRQIPHYQMLLVGFLTILVGVAICVVFYGFNLLDALLFKDVANGVALISAGYGLVLYAVLSIILALNK